MIGYVPGDSPLHRAHPYTPLAIAGAVLLLAFAWSDPWFIWGLVAAGALLPLAGGVVRAIAAPALMLVLPPWLILLVLHGLLGDEPRVALAFGVTLSEPGISRALVLGGRIGAIVVASLTSLATVSPARLVDAMTDRGVPFGRIFLLVSTLTFLPRTRLRAHHILEAQQARGLRLGGSPAARFRALGPLVLPLVLGALAEVDEQVLALESRGATAGGKRTALDPPRDRAGERALRWSLLALVVAAWTAKLGGWL